MDIARKYGVRVILMCAGGEVDAEANVVSGAESAKRCSFAAPGATRPGYDAPALEA